MSPQRPLGSVLGRLSRVVTFRLAVKVTLVQRRQSQDGTAQDKSTEVGEPFQNGAAGPKPCGWRSRK